MKSIAKIICCVATLSWLSTATAEGVVIHENANSVTLESTQTPAASAPQGTPGNVHYDKVDRTRAEQRLESNALRAKKRSEQAKKEAAGRAQQKPANQQNQGSGK